jgi:hypothetical protein
MNVAFLFNRASNIFIDMVKFFRWLMLIVRVVLIGVVIAQLTPAPFRLSIPPQQILDTQEPHVCVHTDLIHEVEEWKIQRTLQLIREMGGGTIVEFFPWAYVEGSQGHFDWSQTDRIIRHAQNQDIKIIARLGLVPQWARDEQTTLNTLPPESDIYFAEFVRTFTARYAGVIEDVVIWNEPNLAFEWGFDDFSPERYSDLLKVVYPQAKAGNSKVRVWAGALAPTLEPVDSAYGLNDLIYLERMYQAGAGDYFDGLAVHTYGFNQPADAEPAQDQLNFRRAEQLRDVMVSYSDEHKPITITEAGWNDNNTWSYRVTPAERITYTLDGFEIVKNEWTWAENLCLWIFRHPTDRDSYRDGYVMVSPDFDLYPIYYAVQSYASGQ